MSDKPKASRRRLPKGAAEAQAYLWADHERMQAVEQHRIQISHLEGKVSAWATTAIMLSDDKPTAREAIDSLLAKIAERQAEKRRWSMAYGS